MRKIYLILSLIVLILAIAIMFFYQSTSKEALSLAESAISNQYNNDQLIEGLYIDEIIRKRIELESSTKKGDNYKIIDIIILEKDLLYRKIWVRAEVEDSSGRYYQHIYITRERNEYLIYDIDFDI